MSTLLGKILVPLECYIFSYRDESAFYLGTYLHKIFKTFIKELSFISVIFVLGLFYFPFSMFVHVVFLSVDSLSKAQGISPIVQDGSRGRFSDRVRKS